MRFARVEANLKTWAGDVPQSKTHITEGNPALEIARLSETLHADLIVMSTKGLTAVEHLFGRQRDGTGVPILRRTRSRDALTLLGRRRGSYGGYRTG